MDNIFINHLNYNYQEVYFYWFQHSMKEQYAPLTPSDKSNKMWFLESEKYDKNITDKFNVLYDISNNTKHITSIDKCINYIIKIHNTLYNVFKQKRDSYYQFGNLFLFYNDRMLRIFQSDKYYSIIKESEKKDLIKNLRKYHYDNFRKFLELSQNYEIIYHKLKDNLEINFHLKFDELLFNLFFCKHIILTNIILYDQFSRIIKRNTKEAYSLDYVTKTFSEKIMSIHSKHLLYLFTPTEFLFVNLPLQHYEDKTLETIFLAFQSIEEYQKVFFIRYKNFAYYFNKNDYKKFFDNIIYHIRGHYDVLKRFGRYPKRNLILNRTNTPEENTYIKLTPDIQY